MCNLFGYIHTACQPKKLYFALNRYQVSSYCTFLRFISFILSYIATKYNLFLIGKSEMSEQPLRLCHEVRRKSNISRILVDFLLNRCHNINSHFMYYPPTQKSNTFLKHYRFLGNYVTGKNNSIKVYLFTIFSKLIFCPNNMFIIIRR